MKILKWIKTNLFILGISSSFILIFFAFIYFSNGPIKGINNLVYSFLYMGIFFLSSLLPNNKFFNIIQIIIGFPYLILMFLMPFLGFLYASIYGLIAPLMAITLFIDLVPENLFNIDLLFATKLYLILTIWSIIVVVFGERIIKKVIAVQENDKPNNRKEKQIEFTLSLINNGIIKFIIYLLFFFTLILFSVSKLNHLEFFDNGDLNSAIIQSFITFLAFDRLIMNKNLFKLIPKDILTKLINAWRTYS